MFSLEETQEMIRSLESSDNVTVVQMPKLTVDVAKEVDAGWIVRGLRVASDFEYELQMAQMNEAISGWNDLHPCASTSSFIASSLVRGSRVWGSRAGRTMVSEPVAKRLLEKFFVSYDPTAMANEPPTPRRVRRRGRHRQQRQVDAAVVVVLLSNKDDVPS